MQDVRWQQRFENFQKALATLERVLATIGGHAPSEIEQLAIIQGFEFTHELAWNLLKDYLRDQGNATIAGSKDATRLAFQVGVITQGEVWMQMISDRNLGLRTYEAVVAEAVADRIQRAHLPALRSLQAYFDAQVREQSAL